jgi:hypothetical protein
MKSAVTLLFILTILNADAQQAVLSSGGNASGSGGSISYSIGQVSYSNSGDNSVNEGVQQPYEFFTVALHESHAAYQIRIFPNPTTHELVIVCDNQRNDLTATIFDAKGTRIENIKLQSSSTRIPVNSWAAATYIITINDSKGTSSSYQLVKN